MKTTVLALVALSTLAACGGGATNYTTRGAYAPQVMFATGPIQRACMAQGRKAASEQRRGVKVFKDPHKLQEWRQSDRARENAFWASWKEFGQNAERSCSGV